MAPLLALAFLSGAPALVYEVVWTREVGLLAGSQIEGLSVVLAAFFGGLAAGARWLGPLADRTRRPLVLYAGLEAAAGLLAVLSLAALRWSAEEVAALPEGSLLLLGALGVLPVTFLLGGTLPALLRGAAPDTSAASRVAGMLVAANTAGAVLGVGAAVWCVPRIGLARTFASAALLGVALGGCAWLLGRGESRTPARTTSETLGHVPSKVLVAAAVAGAATLAFEALAARAAALRLGSSLYAWAGVLGLVLVGLAAGNASFARRASRSDAPATQLGWIQAAAAVAIGICVLGLGPAPAAPARGLSAGTLATAFAGVLPAAFLMGGAFPFLVRLGLREGPTLGSAFGRLSAFNTAGGIAGSLLAPFVLLPSLGLGGALVACACTNALLGAAFLWASGGRPGKLRAGAVVALAGAMLALPLVRAPGSDDDRRLLFVEHDRQATAAVLRVQGRRDLYVDGEPEASTAGDARRTEQLLAALPLLLHPRAESFLEVGLGSAITLGTATRFPLRHIDCVEISAAVIRAAPFFAPQNHDVAAGSDARVRILRADGRSLLARASGRYDVVVANTVHPWSLAATGLYSREYFGRMARALRSGGLAVQWLPVDRIGARDLAAVLRTFYAVFPEGALYWAAGSLLAVGSATPIPSLAPGAGPDGSAILAELNLDEHAPLGGQRLAGARAVREVVGAGPVLSDDVPRLEARRMRRGSATSEDQEMGLVERLAAAGGAEDPTTGPLRLWIESMAARGRGEAERADDLERLAEAAGSRLARRSRADRLAARGHDALRAGAFHEAETAFRGALAAVADHGRALSGLALLAQRRGDEEATRRILERLVAAHPTDAEAWNLLASVLAGQSDPAPARLALEQALRWDPFFPEALANTGLLALRHGDPETARRMLARLAELSPRQELQEERALRAALAR